MAKSLSEAVQHRLLVSWRFVGIIVGVESTNTRTEMPLSDAKIRALKGSDKTQKISDGGGLHLCVMPTGSKLWRMAYRFDGKQKLLSFGAYPATSLVLARQRREDAKALLARGLDPSRQAKAEKEVKRQANGNTFALIADEFLAKVEAEGRADVTLSKKRWLLDMAKEAFGDRPVSEITAADVLAALRKLEAAGTYESAKRLRSVTGQVFRYAVATARADNDPTHALKGALISPKVTHRAALTDWKSFSALLKAVWTYSGSPETRTALQLMALLYPRPGELRQAHWGEFDFAKRVWTIPADRAKMRREHRKPLPKLAVTLLEDLKELNGKRSFVFPSAQTANQPLSENTMNIALRRMGFGQDEMTSHGFRATASTLLNESGLWLSDAIEAELAHKTDSAVRRAYHRAAYWEERVRMADWWANRIVDILQLPDS